MTYIFLVAGKGTRMQPLTSNYPKSLYKLDNTTTVLKRMVNYIKDFDKEAKIVLVIGFMSETVKQELINEDVKFIFNPFYNVTNSIASLWFAREYLDCDNVAIINGDIVMCKSLIKDIICKKTSRPFVLIDSSVRSTGDYNVQINEEKVLVMSKELNDYFGEYAGITKLDKKSASELTEEIEKMVNSGFYDQWYENALVQMIFTRNFSLYYKDIYEYSWTEVDCVSDLIYAKKIHFQENA